MKRIALIIALLATLIISQPAAAQNDECRIYITYGQAAGDDHVTYQIDILGVELVPLEALVHRSDKVLPIILPYLSEFACDVTWTRA